MTRSQRAIMFAPCAAMITVFDPRRASSAVASRASVAASRAVVGLVEEEDFGIVVQGARHRQPLPLAAGHAAAALADDGVDALRKRRDEVVELRDRDDVRDPRVVDLRVGNTEGDIPPQGVVEKEDGLRHVADAKRRAAQPLA